MRMHRVNVAVTIVIVVEVFVFSRGSGRASGSLRGGGHQISFCKTEVNKESDDGIENIFEMEYTCKQCLH